MLGVAALFGGGIVGYQTGRTHRAWVTAAEVPQRVDRELEWARRLCRGPDAELCEAAIGFLSVLSSHLTDAELRQGAARLAAALIEDETIDDRYALLVTLCRMDERAIRTGEALLESDLAEAVRKLTR